MRTLYKLYKSGIYLIFFLSIVIFSCTQKIKPGIQLNYDGNLYHQFWTADWSPDDQYIAVAGVDSILRIYHSNNLTLYKSFPLNSWIHVVRWHPDSKMLAIATLDKYVKLLHIETGQIISLADAGGSRAIGWNFNGDLLAVGELEGLIKIWDRNGKLVRGISKTYGPDVRGRSFLGLDWHPSKNIFIATNFQIALYDTSGTELHTMEHRNPKAIILCVDWHPSGDFFVVGDYGYNQDGENVPSLLHFWTKDGKYSKAISGSKAEYRNISWNKEGTKLATASDVLRVWNKDGIILHEGASDNINYLWGIDWSDKSERIVTASRFKTISLWDSTATLLKRVDVR